MNTVGIKQLKNELSEWVRRAAAGEEIVVTDRGQVVARLVPPAAARTRLPGALEAIVGERGARPSLAPEAREGVAPMRFAGSEEILDALYASRDER